VCCRELSTECVTEWCSVVAVCCSTDLAADDEALAADLIAGSSVLQCVAVS